LTWQSHPGNECLYIKKIPMKKTKLQRIIIGVKKGWTTPNLPTHILKFHLNPLIRILRVIGWFTTLSYLSGKSYQDLYYI